MINLLVIAIKVFEKDLSRFNSDSLFVAKLLFSLILVVNIQVVLAFFEFGTVSDIAGTSSWFLFLGIIVLVTTIIHFCTKNTILQSKNNQQALSPLSRFICWGWFFCSLFVFPIVV